MTDLQIAKDKLPGHTICLCKDGRCIFSDTRGISPMMTFIADGVDLAGYSVADAVVGKAAALLFVKSKIRKVFARTLSEAVKKYSNDTASIASTKRLQKTLSTGRERIYALWRKPSRIPKMPKRRIRC